MVAVVLGLIYLRYRGFSAERAARHPEDDARVLVALGGIAAIGFAIAAVVLLRIELLS